MKFSITDFFSKCLVTFTGEVRKGKWIVICEWIPNARAFVIIIIFEYIQQHRFSVDRNSRSHMCFKIGVLKHFEIFTGNPLCLFDTNLQTLGSIFDKVADLDLQFY